MKEKQRVMIVIRGGHPEDGLVELFGYPHNKDWKKMRCPKCYDTRLGYTHRTNEYFCANCHKGMTNTIKRRVGERKYREIHS